MKKISIMLLAALMLFAFVACDNTEDKPGDDWNIGVRIAKHKGIDDKTFDDHGNLEDVKSATYEDGVITVTADVKNMVAYKSSDPNQDDDDYKWYALLISTGVSDDDTLKVQGVSLDDARSDIATYTAKDGSAPKADEFVLWAKAETEGKLTLEREGASKLTITVKTVQSDAE